MDTLSKLEEISDRIAHLETAADWIANETFVSDHSISQTATLISVLAEEIREVLCKFVKDMERGVEVEKLN